METLNSNSRKVFFWSITVFGRSCCGTCPRSQFRANVTSECFADSASDSDRLRDGLITEIIGIAHHVHEKTVE
jgi:hypothetical protein